MSKQVGLHNHSEYSHLDGFAKVTDLAKRAAELGQSAVALTDHGEVAGHYKFQKACRDQHIKPVFGMEGYWHLDIEAARATKKYPSDLSHICLLAANQKGLQNLWTLSSLAYTDKYHYHRPMADPALLRQFAEGIYASDGCMLSGLGKAVEVGDDDAARRYVATLADIFRERFYMELHTWMFMDPVPDEAHPRGPRCRNHAPVGKIGCQACLNELMTDINQTKVRLATELGVPLVVVNDAHHAWPADWENKDLLNKIKKDKGDQVAEGQKADHLMGEEEIYHWMAQHGIGRNIVEQAIANSHDIAMACDVEIAPTLELPSFSGGGDDTPAFLSLVEQGFKQKVIDAGLDAEAYFARLEPEIQLIADRGLAGYFLTVEDYVRAARTGTYRQYISPGASPDPTIVGPARGSAGGSLVSYLLGITTIDPIKYGLLFERFLNPARKGLPDIDSDFPQSKRPDLKAYLEARWGHDHVCTLSTVSRNGPKGMLRDLGRIYDVPYGEVDQMSKVIESAIAIMAAEREAAGEDATEDDLSWDEVLSEKGGDLAPWAKKYPEMFERLGQTVGVARNAGVHASGVLINAKPLSGLIPTRVNSKTKVTTVQFDMWDLEALGGVKFDLLGIRHLDTLDQARRLIAERHGVTLDFAEFGDKEFSDPAIWEQIDRGQTTGIFQVESPLATRVAVEMRPRNEVDVAALISIIRPGVKDAGLMDEYLARRAGNKDVVYDHPLMRELTEETYGILVYQEQLILAAQNLAGFSLSEGDDLRRALGKKLADEIDALAAKFHDGCLANPAFMEPLHGDRRAAEKVIAKIWSSISAAGRYAFNKSHAVGYAVLATWEVWVKHYYPEEFLVALMATDGDEAVKYIREARRRGIAVLPPDINESDQKFSIDSAGNIRFGLDAVRSVGNVAVKAILKARPYASFEDYLARAQGWAVNKTVLGNLIRIGAFDSLEYNEARDGDWRPGCRARLMQSFHDWRLWMDVAEGKRAKMDAAARAAHIEHLYRKRFEQKGKAWFDAEFAVPDFADPQVVHTIETELVGTFILVDPMEPYLEALDAVAIKDPAEIDDRPVGDIFVIGGQISKIKRHTIARGRFKGKEMAFLGVTYNDADFDITVFNETWNAVKVLIEEGAPVACQVIRDDRGCHLSSLERLDLLWKEAS